MLCTPCLRYQARWTAPQWQGLWTDIIDLVADDDPQPHFLGSIVTAPARTVPEGVEKRLLIDGQQRLTTLVVLLALVRDRARDAGNVKLAEKLQDLVTNRHEEGVDRFKLLPTQGEDPQESDRDAFQKIVAGSENAVKSGISDAYGWFAARLSRADAPELDHLARVVSGKLTLVASSSTTTITRTESSRASMARAGRCRRRTSYGTTSSCDCLRQSTRPSTRSFGDPCSGGWARRI